MEEDAGIAANTAISDGSNLYILGAEKNIGFKNGSLYLKKWNGLFWVDYPKYQAWQMQISAANKISVCVHQNQIYAGASFLTLNSKSGGLIRWNGSKWEELPDGLTSDYLIYPEISVKDMQSFGNRLFVCGEFNRTSKGKKLSNFAILSADTWQAVTNTGGIFHDLFKWNDTLFFCGKFSSIDGKNMQNLGVFYNNGFQPFRIPIAEEIFGVGSYRNQLVTVSANAVKLAGVSSWQALSANWNVSVLAVHQIAEQNNVLYVSGRFANNAGRIFTLCTWNGTTWSYYFPETELVSGNSAFHMLQICKDDLYFGGDIQKINGNSTNRIIRLYPGKAIVKGTMFLDDNENCVQDLGEKPIANAILSLNEGQYYTSTDANGFYSFVLPLNQNITLRIFPDAEHKAGCNPEWSSMNTGNKDTNLIWNYAIFKKQTPQRLGVEMVSSTGFAARHGYWCNYVIKPDPESEGPLEILLTADKKFKSFKSDVDYSQTDVSGYKWQLSEPKEIHCSFYVDHEVFKLDDKLLFELLIRNSKMEYAASLLQTVVAALDPNSKQCDKMKIYASDKNLSYFIQFQNLGSDSAVNIHVVDTISATLPMQYIQITDYSHKNNYQVSFKVRDHAIVWGFKNIMLAPKSVAGDAGSSGYIQFLSGLSSDLKVGNTIANQAHIYFDFQDPVATNVATSLVIDNPIKNEFKSTELTLFPNPGKGILNLKLSNSTIQSVKVFDRDGNQIYEMNPLVQKDEWMLDLSTLSNGIYFIRTEFPTGVLGSKYIILK